MQGKKTFTKEEAHLIRALLQQKTSASRSAQKGIRNQLRSLQFYISDFDTSQRGFTVADFDRLVRTNQVIIGDAAQEPLSPSVEKTSVNADLEAIRASYKPDKVSVLFVGESPPARGTFFYCANSNLFRGIRQGFFEAYNDNRIIGDFLTFFKEKGCYLDDLCLEPVNDKSNEDRKNLRIQGIQPLAQRIQQINPMVVICVMKGISNEVQRAVISSKISGITFEITTFPSGSEANRLQCIVDVKRIVRDLINRNILER